EVTAVRAVQPGRPHHIPGQRQELQHRLFADQLAATVRVDRRGGRVLVVGFGGGAVEHVVGGDLDQSSTGVGAGGGHTGDGVAVDGGRLGFVGFGAVDVGVRGGVDHHVV